MAAHRKAAAVPTHAAELTQRSRLLLDLLVDIKNNRHQKPEAGSSFWLKARDVAPVQLSGISWKLLASPHKQVTASPMHIYDRESSSAQDVGALGMPGVPPAKCHHPAP